MGVSNEQFQAMEEETRQIVENIQSQKLDEKGLNVFIYAIFIVIIISMIFESLVKSNREKLREVKDNKEIANPIKKKLLIIYSAHLATIAVLWFIYSIFAKLPGIYIWFLIVVTVYIVDIAPLFTWHLRKGAGSLFSKK